MKNTYTKKVQLTLLFIGIVQLLTFSYLFIDETKTRLPVIQSITCPNQNVEQDSFSYVTFISKNCTKSPNVFSIDILINKTAEQSVLKDTCLTGLETAIWYLSTNALNWKNGSPIIDSGFAIKPSEGQTSISDKTGKLLFYTDNNNIYNSNHQVMSNGDLYQANLIAGASSTMNLILPKPGSESLFYLIYPDQVSGLFDSIPKKLRYALIDISLNNGLGQVIEKNVTIMDTSSERIEGIRHCNGSDWWIIGQQAVTGEFRSFLLDKSGMNILSPVISNTNFKKINNQKFWLPGYLKATFNGQYLIGVTSGGYDPSQNADLNKIEFHEFDAISGIVSKGFSYDTYTLGADFIYGMEFSPDLSKLYINGRHVWQMDISQFDSTLIISSLQHIFYNPKKNLGAMTLGPNGKIYCTKSSAKDSFLNVINFPNESGTNCAYLEDDFYLGSSTGLGSPHFAASMLFPGKLFISGPHEFCSDTVVKFILSDPCPHPMTNWSLLDGGQMMKNNGDTIQVYYPDKGNFRIVASYPTPCGQKTDTLKVEVTTCNCYPSISWTRMDTSICEGSQASFQFVSNSTEILLNNNLITTDTFSISNLKKDTSIQLMIKYPRSCDSIITVNITVHHPSYSLGQITLCAGDSVFLDNKWIYDTDTVKINYSNSFGCDSTHSIFIQKIKKDSLQLQAQICEGDSVLVFGIWQSIPKILRQNYISSKGCDSAVSYEIKVNPVTLKQTNQFKICPGDSILLNGNWYKDSSMVIEKLRNQFGCDSIIENEISFYPQSNPTIEVKLVCQGDSILIQGKYYKDTITIQESIQNQFGCDSIHQIQVHLKPELQPVDLSFYFCKGDSVQIKNSWYYRESSFKERKSSLLSCDTLITYHAIFYKEAFVDLGNDLTLSRGEIITLNPSHSPNVVSYKWFPTDGLSCSNCPSPEITATQNKTYFLEVSDRNGCTALDSISIRIKEANSDIYVPNIFSPNGDNINDVFQPIFNEVQIEYYRLQIYDRWGNLLFESLNKDKGWNGKYQDHNMNLGVYTYVIQYQVHEGESKVKAGDVTLVR